MIIACNNCKKSFNVDSDLIPKKGRLLQCYSCNHKWFFTKKITNDSELLFKHNNRIEDSENVKVENASEKSKFLISEKIESIELLDRKIKNESMPKKILINEKIEERETIKGNKNYNILGLTIVFIISFIALIIISDTFKGPIGKIVPNIEFLLYNLYESIKDIELFLTDLI